MRDIDRHTLDLGAQQRLFDFDVVIVARRNVAEVHQVERLDWAFRIVSLARRRRGLFAQCIAREVRPDAPRDGPESLQRLTVVLADPFADDEVARIAYQERIAVLLTSAGLAEIWCLQHRRTWVPRIQFGIA